MTAFPHCVVPGQSYGASDVLSEYTLIFLVHLFLHKLLLKQTELWLYIHTYMHIPFMHAFQACSTFPKKLGQ